MEEFISTSNKTVIFKACKNMITDKYNHILRDDILEKFLKNVFREVIFDEKLLHLKLNELNNITLGKIKTLFMNYINEQDKNYQTQYISPKSQRLTETVQESILDNETISNKLKDLEFRRKIIPNFTEENIEKQIEPVQPAHSELTSQPSIVYKTEPISVTIPPVEEKKFKTIIINSANRDWIKNPIRNNIEFKLATDTNSNVFYPQSLLLPSRIKNMTPYVFLHLSDEFTDDFCSFTCSSSSSDKWDIWSPVDNVESISLTSNNWSMKLLDFTNNSIDLGKDDIEISKVFKQQHFFQLFLSNEDIVFQKNDSIQLKFQNGKHIWKQICEVNEISNTITISDYNEEITIQDFVGCKVLLGCEQFSLILKYCNT